MKFYVYKTKPNPEHGYQLYFIGQHQLTRWSAIYNPEVMEFVGVSLNATSEEDARHIYLDNALCIEHVMTDEEPVVTKIATTKQKISEVTMDVMVKRLAKLWIQIDDMLRAMADVYVLHNKDMTKEQAYIDLKQRWLKRYLDMPLNEQ